MILEHHALCEANGQIRDRRRDQARAWMWKLLEEGIDRTFRERPGMAEAIAREEEAVASQQTSPAAAARKLLRAFGESTSTDKD